MARRNISIGIVLMSAAIVAFFAHSFTQESRTIPVLAYHIITNDPQGAEAASVETKLLAQELDYLAANTYTTLTLADAASRMRAGTLPQKVVVLTFDDADRGQFLYALPLLISHHMVATFFPPSSWIGQSGNLTWDDLRALEKAGMEIGGHTETHPHLFGLSDAELTQEIAGDKTALEKQLGISVTSFAYPYGEENADILAIVERAGYRVSRLSVPSAPQMSGTHVIFGASVMTNSFDAFLTALSNY